MSRLVEIIAITSLALCGSAASQLTTTPGPGGIPIAPGAPLGGYTPGGIGLSGVEVAPGRAAAFLCMARDPAEFVSLFEKGKRKKRR